MRVVLDTNVLISALLFKGTLSRLVGLWTTGRIVPLVTKATFSEFLTVLSYPKFNLTEDEIRIIVHDCFVPFAEVVEETRPVSGVCADPDDDMFLTCGVSGMARILVTGDQALLDLKEYEDLSIVSPAMFFDMLGS